MTAMRFSRRVPGDLRPSRLAAARERAGPPPFDLTVSDPTRCGLPYPSALFKLPTDDRVRRYRPEPRGPEEARRAVARWLARYRPAPDAERLVLTASTSEAYGFLFRLLLDPGDTVLVPVPSYPLFDQLARLDGVRTAPLTLDAEARWRLEPGALAAAPASTRAVVVVHPNNPTGHLLDPEDHLLLVDWCRDRGAALIADEVFLPYPLKSETSPASLAGSGCLTFTLGGLSKCVGLPQLKLAWIAVDGPEADCLAALERLDWVADAYLSVSAPVAAAAATLLERGEVVHRAILQRCRRNLATLAAAVARLPALELAPPDGGWSAVLRVPNVLGEEELVLELLAAGVGVHPGYLFDFPSDGWLVLGLLAPEQVHAAGVARLVEVVAKLVG